MIDIRDAFFDKLYEIAKKDKNVILLTVDLGAFSLDKFKRDLKDQYINVGIAEQNIINLASGLTLEKKSVFVYGLSSFITTRCFEQIKVDLSGMNLPVKIIGSGPGICYSIDGPTHHAIQDVAIMRSLPNMIIYSPSDSTSASNIAKLSYESKNPVYIRIDKGKYPSLYSDKYDFTHGLSIIHTGKDLLIITTGMMVHQAIKLSEKLNKINIDTCIIDLFRINPINEQLLLSIIKSFNRIVTIEEHSLIGGIGSIVSELLTDNNIFIPLKRFGINDKNCDKCGDRDWMQKYYNLDIDSIFNSVIHEYRFL